MSQSFIPNLSYHWSVTLRNRYYFIHKRLKKKNINYSNSFVDYSIFYTHATIHKRSLKRKSLLFYYACSFYCKICCITIRLIFYGFSLNKYCLVCITEALWNCFSCEEMMTEWEFNFHTFHSFVIFLICLIFEWKFNFLCWCCNASVVLFRESPVVIASEI